MHRFFVEQDYANTITLEGKLAHHIGVVLRMTVGEELKLVFDDGVIARCTLQGFEKNRVTVAAVEILAQGNEPSVQVTLGQGLAKGEKMDLVVQKAVEVGATTIIPLALENSVARFDSERSQKKVERWQKIALEAAQQSKRDAVPKVEPVQGLQQALTNDYDLIIMAYEGETQVTLKDILAGKKYEKILLLIGPEGGFTEEEVELCRNKGARTVTLGRRILRTETAGLVALSCIFYEYGG